MLLLNDFPYFNETSFYFVIFSHFLLSLIWYFPPEMGFYRGEFKGWSFQADSAMMYNSSFGWRKRRTTLYFYQKRFSVYVHTNKFFILSICHFWTWPQNNAATGTISIKNQLKQIHYRYFLFWWEIFLAIHIFSALSHYGHFVQLSL